MDRSTPRSADVQGVTGLWTHYLRMLLAAATYRPERHYMRGSRGSSAAPANQAAMRG